MDQGDDLNPNPNPNRNRNPNPNPQLESRKIVLLIRTGQGRVEYIADKGIAVLLIDGDDIHRPRPHIIECPQAIPIQWVIVFPWCRVHGDQGGRLVTQKRGGGGSIVWVHVYGYA